jgi:phage baseplate assembly protein W
MVAIDAISKNVIYGASGIIEVIQNVRTLLTTRVGTVPLDRNFGVNLDFLDDPLPQAKAELQTEIFQKIKKYEPRAILKEISFEADALSGRLAPRCKIEVKL